MHLACALHHPKKWFPILKSLREEGITVSADFGWNPDISVNQLISIIKYCEFVFPNEHEACAVTGMKSALHALEKLSEWVRVPIVKLGAKGAMLMSGGKIYKQPALLGTIVDATGAGDAFNGGFLMSFSAALSGTIACERAISAAAWPRQRRADRRGCLRIRSLQNICD